MKIKIKKYIAELSLFIHIPEKQFLKIKIKKYIAEMSLFIHIPRKIIFENKTLHRRKNLTSLRTQPGTGLNEFELGLETVQSRILNQ